MRVHVLRLAVKATRKLRLYNFVQYTGAFITMIGSVLSTAKLGQWVAITTALAYSLGATMTYFKVHTVENAMSKALDVCHPLYTVPVLDYRHSCLRLSR